MLAEGLLKLGDGEAEQLLGEIGKSGKMDDLGFGEEDEVRACGK